MFRSTSFRINCGDESAGPGRFVAKTLLSRGYLAAAVMVAGLAVACTQPGPSNPTPTVQTPVSAATSLPTAGEASPSPTTESASPTALVNGTATVQAEATVIAIAVEGTVTAKLHGVGTATALSALATPTAVAPTNGPGSVTPTAAVAAVPACPAQPVRGFGALYNSQSTVATRLGCAVQAETGTSSTIQLFDGGVMLEFGNSKQIIVLRNIGSTWSVVSDAYLVGQALPTPTVTPPSGRFAPLNGFGQVWQQQVDIQTQLGWATAPEQQFPTGASEQFAHGRMFWTPNKIDYVLYSDNTWQSFPDTFQG